MTNRTLYGKIYLSHNFILLYRYRETISWQKMFLSFSASLNGDKKLCDNNEGHIFAGAFLIIGAHFFCYLKFYFIIKENIK